ncbi:penicillin-binding protein 2 [Candidatus Parcubacteria bacterium]|nr:MAG: penicillin-binding protein 2 [Candidatus Parcubacteria bacterium]
MYDDFDPFAISPKDQNNTLGGRYKLSWVEDSLTMGGANQREEVVDSGSSHIGSSFTTKKLFYFLMLITLSFVFIVSRLLYLQILQGDEYRARAEGNRQRIIPIPSERGLVFDRNNIQLTQNVPNFSLTVIPQDLPRDNIELNQVIVSLADITNKSVEEISDIIQKYRHYQRESIVVDEDIPYEIALKVQIAASELPGIHIQRGSKRLYIHEGMNEITDTKIYEEELDSNHASISHILGYVGKLSPEELETYYEKGYLPSDSIGKIGVEKTYEEFLRGVYGKKRIEVNARGKEQQILAEESPKSGAHIVLSIDNEMQKQLELFLQKGMDKVNRTRAAGVAMDPQTGEILALVSLPGFDNNDFSGGIDSETYSSYIQDESRPLFNRSIAGTYPSGSVIKPAIASAALQEKVITSRTTFKSVGGIAVGQWFFPDWKAGGHGITDVRESIAWSVNTFYYYIGGGYREFVGLGVKRITDYLKEYGLSEKLGIDLPSEAKGFLPSPEWKKDKKGERWYVGDTYNLSIGQGDLLITPLQITAVTAAISNGGKLYKPHVVQKMIDPDTGEETYIQSEVLNSDFIDQNHLETIKLGMYDCVDHGSCWDLRRLPFGSGGKTGTAQWNSNRDTHAWFTAFAPYDNPEIAVTILVEEGGEGGWVAEPIAAEFLEWWAQYKTQN